MKLKKTYAVLLTALFLSVTATSAFANSTNDSTQMMEGAVTKNISELSLEERSPGKNQRWFVTKKDTPMYKTSSGSSTLRYLQTSNAVFTSEKNPSPVNNRLHVRFFHGQYYTDGWVQTSRLSK